MLFYRFAASLLFTSWVIIYKGVFSTPTAYVLINCRLGREVKIINQSRTISGIIEADGVYGLYDIFAKITKDTDAELELALRNIRRIEHIISTNTLIKIAEQG